MDFIGFVKKWSQNQQKERASYTSHFSEVCELVNALPPTADPTGEEMAFEKAVIFPDGKRGFADVWYKGRFVMEYKAKGRSLSEAHAQLMTYSRYLDNPPLLVVCDFDRWEIHTNFTGSRSHVTQFTNEDLLKPEIQQHLHNLFFNPQAFLQYERQALTKEAGVAFAAIVESMEAEGETPEHIANFLTRILFCLFADSIGMLPQIPISGNRKNIQFSINGEQGGLFQFILQGTSNSTNEFQRNLKDLFNAMANGHSIYIFQVAYFNGSLFEAVYDPKDALTIPALTRLVEIADLEWRAVDPSIFGAVFERTLNAEKRAQLGAHYTSEADIKLIVEPVLMAPYRREWAALQPQVDQLRVAYDAATSLREKGDQKNALLALRDAFLGKLRSVKVLDPACGSSNFLYVALRMLLDLEHEVLQYPAFRGLEDTAHLPAVHPRQLYGIEIDPIAHALASIVVWIGYWQWRIEHSYHPPLPTSRFETLQPYLEPLSENIVCKDAILAYDAAGNPIEPEWPKVDVIVGNPPFLGGGLIRGELGDKVIEDLWKLYAGRLPGFADLVCYWFERARAQVEKGDAARVGLLATNSIRGGANREVLKRIKDTGDIFMAWSDREWALNGASVRVSMVGFDSGEETSKTLDGMNVEKINSDLTSIVDVTIAKRLQENTLLGFMGVKPNGVFQVSTSEADKMITADLKNNEVLLQFYNGQDVTTRWSGRWIVDFNGFTLPVANEYQLPMEHVITHVKPMRDNHKTKKVRESWWQHERPRPQMRQALTPLKRYIVTARVAKHRLFVWFDKTILPDSQLIVIAREDDYFIGALHSRLHEVWSLRMGTSLGATPRYTPVTTFETFPFPWPPGQEPTDDPRVLAIAAAAKQLHEERAAWLDPDGMSERAKSKRTLTNLYNALNVWRGVEAIRTVPEAADFAPRLDALHQALDRAVCAAYGWPHDILADDEAMLRHLLALNLERAAAGGAAIGGADEDDGEEE